jgi:internalin A
MGFFKKLFSGSNSSGQTDCEKHWTFYKEWLQQKLPLYHSYLNQGATEKEIAFLKSNFSFKLPDELIQLYSLNNGDKSLQQDLPLGSFMQFEFLSISRLLEVYNLYKDIINQNPDLLNPEHYSSYPKNTVKRVEFNINWIPVFADSSGNFIAIDLDPDANGTCGQVINFGRDENMRFQIAKSLTDFLAFINQRIESGKCDQAIVQEDDGGYSYGLHPQSHLLDGLRHIIVEGQDGNRLAEGITMG